jgi:hypothetical protein
MGPLHPLSLIVRWAHVAGMAAILGGALLVWWLALRRDRIDDKSLIGIAERYEWIFWGAIGLQVMTGVGNLGAFGAGLPAPDSGWGAKLTVKLLAVLALGVLSVPRTLAIATLSASGQPAPKALSRLYGGTIAVVLGILGLAVWLAHG